MKAECADSHQLVSVEVDIIRPFTVAGAAQVRRFSACGTTVVGAHGFCVLLLPVELQHANHTASTNSVDSKSGKYP